MESPVDHTSAQMVYSLPVMRSGWCSSQGVSFMCAPRVGSLSNRAHRHVLGRPRESARARADELAGNAKVTKFDYALSREEDIRGLDVPVDDLLGMQVRKTLQDLGSRSPR
jgi:hypothetical protein